LGFRSFFTETEPILRRIFVARFGPDRGADATAEALGYAWRNWEKVSAMERPVAYLYTVGRSRTRWYQRPLETTTDRAVDASVHDIDLARALKCLTGRQRECVVLVEALNFTYKEASETLGLSRSSVQRHVERAKARLKVSLSEGDSND
jgi:RNA polymerase sigma factor (sigma-70 family)